MRADLKVSSGFSIVEILVVVGIIAIMSAIAIPMGLNYVRSYQVMSAAQSVASQMQYGRLQAVKRNTRNGIILSFDYPGPRQFQWTTLDWNPAVGGPPADAYYPGPVNVPAPPNNTDSPGGGLPSPHGPVVSLPTGGDMIFDTAGGTFTSLLFRANGTVEGAVANGVASLVISQNGTDFVVRVRDQRYGLSRTITLSRNGRVSITIP